MYVLRKSDTSLKVSDAALTAQIATAAGTTRVISNYTMNTISPTISNVLNVNSYNILFGYRLPIASGNKVEYMVNLNITPTSSQDECVFTINYDPNMSPTLMCPQNFGKCDVFVNGQIYTIPFAFTYSSVNSVIVTFQPTSTNVHLIQLSLNGVVQ